MFHKWTIAGLAKHPFPAASTRDQRTPDQWLLVFMWGKIHCACAVKCLQLILDRARLCKGGLSLKIYENCCSEPSHSCMCSWNVPRFTTGKHQLATKNNTLQAVGCDQQIILNSRGFFFKHHFLTSVLVKCVHGEYKAKTNKPRVFEQSVEQPLQMAFAMKEGLAVNVGLPGLKCHWASPSTKAAGQVR